MYTCFEMCSILFLTQFSLGSNSEGIIEIIIKIFHSGSECKKRTSQRILRRTWVHIYHKEASQQVMLIVSFGKDAGFIFETAWLQSYGWMLGLQLDL